MCAALLVALPTSAAGQEEAPEQAAPAPEREWAKGVSQADQQKALALHEKGNRAFVEREYTPALESYEQAIKSWDHPAIRFNMAECFIHLDRPVEAYENVLKSISFGAAPLGEQMYERALTNKKLLEGQLATLEIKSSEAGATVTLNGEVVLSDKGSTTRTVKPGRYQLVATKTGKLTLSKELTVLPGENTVANVKLYDQTTGALERRWSTWVPWTVVGAGVALGLSGGGLQLHAQNKMNKYDDEVALECTSGCTDLIAGIANKRTTAKRQSTIGLSLVAVGGAALVTGIVLVIANQPRPVGPTESDGAAMAVTPYVTSEGGGVAVTFDF
jgi:hypothetical protein